VLLLKQYDLDMMVTVQWFVLVCRGARASVSTAEWTAGTPECRSFQTHRTNCYWNLGCWGRSWLGWDQAVFWEVQNNISG